MALQVQGHPRSFILAPIELSKARMRLPIGHYFSNSKLGPILLRFRDIACFLLRTTPHLFHPNFRGVPLGLDYMHGCCQSAATSKIIVKALLVTSLTHVSSAIAIGIT